MLYTLYEAGRYAITPWRIAAQVSREFWGSALNPAAGTEFGRGMHAGAEFLAGLTRRHQRPVWGIEAVEISGHTVRVAAEPVWTSPWVRMIRFSRNREDLQQAGVRNSQPAVVLVAPLSGHHATLLRDTARTFLKDHEVYVTDWSNARDVPTGDGGFDLEDFVDQLRLMLAVPGGRSHVVAVCQPGPAALACAALMAEDEDPARPASMTFMASPIDTRLSPTAPNRLAEGRPFSWFRSSLIHVVPPPWAGAGRRVYPGFIQLFSFIAMNPHRHRQAHFTYLEHLMKGDGDGIQKHREFYDEYLSVLDLTEEFYLQTIRDVFQEHLLPRGLWRHRGRAVRPDAIHDIGLLTVEGGLDDVCGPGQTQAAQALCTGLSPEWRSEYVQADVGHYGVFNGARFRQDIYPRIRDHIRRFERSSCSSGTRRPPAESRI